MEMYLEDRKKLHALPMFSKTEKETFVTTSPALKLKPILVDKQASEPSSPEAKNFREIALRRPMQRGYSDLGNRIKKRVTLR